MFAMLKRQELKYWHMVSSQLSLTVLIKIKINSFNFRASQRNSNETTRLHCENLTRTKVPSSVCPKSGSFCFPLREKSEYQHISMENSCLSLFKDKAFQCGLILSMAKLSHQYFNKGFPSWLARVRNRNNEVSLIK